MAACVFETTYVLGIEWVHSKYRVLGSTIISVSYPLGSMFLGLVAMSVHNFRTLIRVLYPPGLIVFVYIWLMPESIRWLLITGRVDRAISTLQRIAKVNRKDLSEKSIELIKLKYSRKPITNGASSEENNGNQNQSLSGYVAMIFKSRKLCGRFFICCYLWMACYFSYYGISSYSTHIQGTDKYTGFMVAAAVEIPTILLAQQLLNRMKRKTLLIVSLCLTTISIIGIPFIPANMSDIILICLLFGKASMTFAFTLIFIFTAEQWPTNIRGTIMHTCAMIGRIGSMVAPFILILVSKHFV